MKLQCISCGDYCISLKSHVLFCKGMDKGQPWLVMQMTGENMGHWKTSAKFQRWARELGISFPEIQAKVMAKPRL
jgi:hypothetical protein